MVHGHLSVTPAQVTITTAKAASLLAGNSKTPTSLRTMITERVMLAELRVNGLAVVPPSINQKTGEAIEWVSAGDPADFDRDELSRRVAQVAAAALIARNWRQGSHVTLQLYGSGRYAAAGWLGNKEAVEKFVLAVCTAAKDEELSSRLQDVKSAQLNGLEDDETATGAPTLEGILDGGHRRKGAGMATATRFPHVETDASSVDHHHTDLGATARRLVALHGHNLRYCCKWKQWLVWNNSRWVPDDTGEVQPLAKATIEAIHSEAGSMANGAGIELRKHALRSESEARLRAMVELAKTEPGIPVTPEELDADLWLLNCLNGTLNLRTGELLSSKRECLCTKQVSVAFDPQATCPVWEAFLHHIMKGRVELIRFLQRAIGYSLTGMINEQVIFLFYGRGANGKSTFIETVRHLLGDYAQQADFSTFLEKKGDSPRNDLARLKGARFVAAVEAAEGRKLSETVIKQFRGGDTSTARFLYGEFFEYQPQLKLFLVAQSISPRLPERTKPYGDGFHLYLSRLPFRLGNEINSYQRNCSGNYQASWLGLSGDAWTGKANGLA